MDSKDNGSVLNSEIETNINENSCKNELSFNSPCCSNVIPEIISGEETGYPFVTNSQLEQLVDPNIFNINESSEIVKREPSVNSTHLENPHDFLEITIIPKQLELEDNEYHHNDPDKGEIKVKTAEPFEIFCDSTSQPTSNPDEICVEENLSQKPTLLDQSNNSLHVRDTFVTPCRDICKSNVLQQGVVFSSTPLNEQDTKRGIRNVFDNLSIIKEEEESLLDESKELPVKITEPEQTTRKSINAEIENKLSEFSVLRKDELSVLIDISTGRILTEEKVDVNKNHLTLPIKNSESVVYKNIIDRTVDDLLIEGIELERINELCNLEFESDRKEILEKAVAIKPFVSSNADENRDNNDPEWELLKKLETDDERYKGVRKLWRNLAIPDLKQNLSTFNWRKKNSLPTLKNIVPIKTNEIGRRKKNLIYECTEVFDVGIKKIEDFCHKQYQGVKLESDNETSMMGSLKKKLKLDSEFAHVANRYYQASFDKINVCFQERLKRHMEAKEEIKAVHGFYNGLKNQGNSEYGNVMLISHKERQHILEIESMINHYTVWYP